MNITKLANYFKIAKVLAENSHDTKTQVGALLVHKNTGAILSTGYNGYVRGAPDENLPNGDDDAKHDFMMHAEMNLLGNAARHGICVANAIVVCTLSPCKLCMRLLWNAGVDTIYFPQENVYKDLEESCNMGDIEVGVVIINETYVQLKLSAKGKSTCR